MIDPEKGIVNFSGWDVDIEDKVIVNWEDGTPLSTDYRGLNKLKYKGWNYYILYTQDHVIHFNLVDLSIICPSSLIIFEKHKAPYDTLLKAETKT